MTPSYLSTLCSMIHAARLPELVKAEAVEALTAAFGGASLLTQITPVEPGLWLVERTGRAEVLLDLTGKGLGRVEGFMRELVLRLDHAARYRGEGAPVEREPRSPTALANARAVFIAEMQRRGLPELAAEAERVRIGRRGICGFEASGHVDVNGA